MNPFIYRWIYNLIKKRPKIIWNYTSIFKPTVKGDYLGLIGTGEKLKAFEISSVKYTCIKDNWLQPPNYFDISMVFDINDV